MLGAVVSTTLKLVVHCELLPAASVTVMVMVVEPSAAVAPAKGDCVIVSDELQLSEAETVEVKSGTKAVQFAPALTVCTGAQAVIVGTVVSTPVKLVVQVVVLPAASATVMVTEVAPRPTIEPAAGACVTEVTAQLSVAVTVPVKSGKAT
jgi:hypothetical protein